MAAAAKEELHEGEEKGKLQALDVAREVESLKHFSVENVKRIWDSHEFSEEVTREEFGRLVHSLLELPTDSEVTSRLFQLSAGREDNGKVALHDFCSALTVLSVGEESSKLGLMFDLFDLNGDGLISEAELAAVIETFWSYSKALGLVRFAAEESRIYGSAVFAKRLFDEAHKPHDGHLNREEYGTVISRYLRYGRPSAILETQTGGHVGAFKLAEPGQLMKKVGKGERHFYAEVLHTIEGLGAFCPRFYRIHEEDGDSHIVMEDLCYGYEKPCILDLKVGTTSIGEDATPEKRAVMAKKDFGSTTVTLGLRFTGMRVWNPALNEFERYNKTWGRAVTDAGFDDSLALFFAGTGSAAATADLIGRFLVYLKELREWMNAQHQLRFFSSSLLFLYDGADPAKKERCRMIDFAHVFPIRDGGRDEGYLVGLNNLIRSLETLSTRT